jgi:hypothetical protein
LLVVRSICLLRLLLQLRRRRIGGILLGPFIGFALLPAAPYCAHCCTNSCTCPGIARDAANHCSTYRTPGGPAHTAALCLPSLICGLLSRGLFFSIRRTRRRRGPWIDAGLLLYLVGTL